MAAARSRRSHVGLGPRKAEGELAWSKPLRGPVRSPSATTPFRATTSFHHNGTCTWGPIVCYMCATKAHCRRSNPPNVVTNAALHGECAEQRHISRQRASPHIWGPLTCVLEPATATYVAMRLLDKVVEIQYRRSRVDTASAATRELLPTGPLSSQVGYLLGVA